MSRREAVTCTYGRDGRAGHGGSVAMLRCHGEERRVRLLDERLQLLRSAGAQEWRPGWVSGDIEAVSVGRRSLITCL